MRLRTKKTDTETTLPISAEALELCGEHTTGKVFKGLERHMVQVPLKKWIKSAGIDKKITFHTSRHVNFYLSLRTNKLQILFHQQVTI